MMLDPRFAAHDLRHLLGLVRGHAELLLADADQQEGPETTRSGLNEIIYATDRAVEMCEDLLQFGGRKNERSTQSSSVSSLCDAVERLGLKRFQSSKVTLEVVKPEFEASVQGDAALLRRGLLNLVWNAIEAASATDGAVRLRVTQCDSGISFAVEDNGPGLPEAYLGDLSELAPPGDGAWRSDAKGELHGFGLLIVALVARTHGGSLHGEVGPHGVGAVLRLTLPEGSLESPR